MSKYIHIVSFDIPYPADYGGVIDVFNKVKALHNKRCKIILHCFAYSRPEREELDKYCEQVYYYPRRTGFLSQLSILPYIVYSRRSDILLDRLSSDDYPVLFEGLHSCYYLHHKKLRFKKKLVRTHNIEHRYYYRLFLAGKNLRAKVFFLIESFKLFFYQNILRYSDAILAISQPEKEYFNKKFGKCILVNAFHTSNEVSISPGIGKYLLFHGNLSVPENEKTALFLLENVFSEIDYPVIIAGKKPSDVLIKKAAKLNNVRLIRSPEQQTMKKLISEAQIGFAISFQSTGIKLKLLEFLFSGRFCIANTRVLNNTGLEDLCEKANSPSEIVIRIKQLMSKEFTNELISFRKVALRLYYNQKNAETIINTLGELEDSMP